MFDDRIVVESPGSLPGIVRLNNMRQVHFSRNPKIAAFLHEYDYVQEFGEGVDRMYKEMEIAGLPAPEYRNVAFMLHATIRNSVNTSGATSDASGATSDASGATSDASGATSDASGATSDASGATSDDTIQTELSEHEFLVYCFVKAHPESSARVIADNIHLSIRTVQRCISTLLKKNVIKNVGTRQRIKWQIQK